MSPNEVTYQLQGLDLTELKRQIRGYIRNTIGYKHPDWFPNGGALRITFFPECEEADVWFGGESDFANGDIISYSSDCSIVPGGKVYGIIDGEECDFSAIAESKIASCDLAARKGLPVVSGDPRLNEIAKMSNGYAPWKGAGEIVVSLHGEMCFTVFVSVSGSEEDNDATAAALAVLAVRNFFKNTEFEVKSPLEIYIGG